MRLLHVELADVGPFAHFAADLSGQLVAVVGPNGSGKSTLLAALHYAVTGDHGRLGGAEAARWDRPEPTAKSAQPKVALRFEPEPGAGPALVTRWLPDGARPGRRRLVHADRSWTAQADLADRFEAWTGLAAKVVSDFVFAEQGKLDGVVTAPPAARAAVLSRLFGVERAEAAHRAVAAHLAALPAPADAGVLAALTARRAEAELAALEAEAARAACLPVDEAADAADRGLVARHEAALRAGRERDRLSQRLTDLDAQLAQPEPEPPEPHELEQVDAVLAAWDRRRHTHAVVTAAAVRLAAARDRVDALPLLPEPAPPPRLAELAPKKFALATLAAAPDTGGACPVCCGPLEPSLGDRQEARRLVGELAALEAAHAKAQASCARRRAEHAAAVADLNRARREVEEAVDALTPEPAVPEELARGAGEDCRRRQWAADADRKRRAVLAAERARLAAALAALSCPEPPAELEVARAAKQLADLVAQAEAARAAADRLAPLRAHLEAVAGVLHRDAAPAAAVRACLAELTGDLNRRLGHLAADFRVALDADGALLADGGRGRGAAARLSGGQRVLLGLAWRLALLDRYAPKVGLLCLDEPTLGLDGKRVAALTSALEAWRPHGSDRQFVVVTHDRRLLRAFDRVVELS